MLTLTSLLTCKYLLCYIRYLSLAMPSFTFVTRRELPDTAREMQDRIKYLFAIREELDRELELLMGRRDTFEPAKPWHCVRCDYDWRSRLPHRPRQCPKCKAKKFDSPPLYTYAEKVARKAANGKLPPPLAHSVITRQVPPPQVSTEADTIQNVALTPPPTPGTMNPVPLSLRERLAQRQAMKPQVEPIMAPEPVTVEATEDELMDVINGEPDAT